MNSIIFVTVLLFATSCFAAPHYGGGQASYGAPAQGYGQAQSYGAPAAAPIRLPVSYGPAPQVVNIS